MGVENLIFLAESYDLIGATTVLGVLYGITFTLYCHCSWQLYLKLQNPDNRRQARITLGYISVVFLCTTGLLAFGTRLIQVAYISHGDFFGGPLVYEETPHSTVGPYFATMGILESIVEVLTMVIQIRRLWIIWSGTRYATLVTVLPVLLLLCYIALVIPIDIVIALDVPVNIGMSSVPQTQQLGIPTSTINAMTTASYAIMSALTILVTALIAARLLLARRQHVKTMGMSEAASPYLSIVAMLVESYSLDAAWSLASALSYALGSPSQIMLVTNDSTIKVIAYFLVIYRVETGQGWTRRTEGKLTSLQWNHGAQTATSEVSSIQYRAFPAPPASVTINPPPIDRSSSAV